MLNSNPSKFTSAIFLTFSGNCKEALTFYQTCFGGTLQVETFKKEIHGYSEMPVVSGSLVSDNIVIHGSDLVPNEGRILGNHMAIFMHCATTSIRKELLEKLGFSKKDFFYDEKLVEIIDDFDVRWVLSV